jgi:hypothetical protein
MIAPGDAGKADCTSQAVRDKGNPTIIAVAVSDDSGDRGASHRMHGIEAAGMGRTLTLSAHANRVWD